MRITHEIGIALVVGTLVCGCSQKLPTTSKPSPKVNSDIPVVAPPKAVSTSKHDVPQELTVFLPDNDGKLRRTTIKEPGDLTKQKLWKPESALVMLFRKAPRIMPAGTRLAGSVRKNKESAVGTVFEVRLNKEFLRSDLWRDSKKAQLAFDAITKTAASGILETISPTYPTRIYALVEEKPVRKLGKLKVINPVTEG